jgi:hypothetical protein
MGRSYHAALGNECTPEILAGRGDAKPRLAAVRTRIGWLTREYMPTKGATAALGAVKDALLRLHDEPPAKAGDLAVLRQTIAVLLEVIDGHPARRAAGS